MITSQRRGLRRFPLALPYCKVDLEGIEMKVKEARKALVKVVTITRHQQTVITMLVIL